MKYKRGRLTAYICAMAVVFAVAADNRPVIAGEVQQAVNAAMGMNVEVDATAADGAEADGAAAILADVMADKTKLKAQIDSAEKLNPQSDTYTADTWSVLYAAYTGASTVYADESASQSEVDAQTALLSAAQNALVRVNTAALADGTYQINAEIVNAADPSRLSMADGALDADTASNGNRVKKPLTLTVKNGQGTLTMKFVSLTNDLNGTQFTGYLGKLQYYPNYSDTTKLPGANEKLADATVVSTYKTYDEYNDSEFGLDSVMRGIYYPEKVSIPVTLGDTEVWLKVYVPVMEAIADGCGTQQARLVLDWSDGSLKQVRDSSIDVSELAARIKAAKAVTKGEATDESWTTLQAAITAAQGVHDSLSSSQAEIDEQTTVLEKAMAVVHLENGTSDKSKLESLIEKAEKAAKQTTVYTKSSLDILSTVLTCAKGVYTGSASDQQSVDVAANALSSAIKGLVKKSSISTKALEAAIESAEKLANETTTYTSDSIDTLKIAINNAKRVLANEEKSQDDVDAQVTSLSNAQKGLIKRTVVDKSALKKKIESASGYAKKTSTYTAASISSLKTAITNARSVYNDKSATQKSVDAQVSNLETAISTLAKKGNSKLNVNKLADGVYSVTGNMVKVDKKTASMSDAAINHTIKLTVKKGKYYITMNFNGLTVSNKLGYLSKLKYFKTGYKLDSYGNPKGSLASVTVDSYQKNSDGSLVSDSYGTNYPDEVTFALISEARKNGYVPLQVFVPIMEAISAGTGTQPVFLKLDWTTLEKTTADNPEFSKSDSGNKGGTTNASEKSQGSSSLNGGSSLSGGSSLNGGSTLSGGSKLSGGATLGSSTLGSSSKLGGGSSLGSSLSQSTGALGSNSLLQSTGTLGSNSLLQSTGTLGDSSELGSSPLSYAEDASDDGASSVGSAAKDGADSLTTGSAETGSDSRALMANTMLLVFIFVGEVVIFVSMMVQRKRAKRELGDDE